MLATFIPHTADEAYRALTGRDDVCVHLEHHRTIMQPCDSRWSQVLALRELANAALEKAKERGIENRLDAGIRVADTHGHLADFAADLPDLLGVSRVIIAQDQLALEVIDLRAEPQCERSWKRDSSVKARSDGGMLSDRDAEAVGVR